MGNRIASQAERTGSKLAGGVVLSGNPFSHLVCRAGQLVQTGEHSFVVGPGAGEHGRVGRGELSLGGLQAAQQGCQGALLVTAQIAHIPKYLPPWILSRGQLAMVT